MCEACRMAHAMESCVLMGVSFVLLTIAFSIDSILTLPIFYILIGIVVSHLGNWKFFYGAYFPFEVLIFSVVYPFLIFKQAKGD